ncbi:hypothetical protein AB0P02_17405 [Streptomyces griseoluteus]|uniref:hypothetical protein n=1 Tax=Streptomyces griseoluteus TaxID=29306 RepID=UPI00343AD27E
MDVSSAEYREHRIVIIMHRARGRRTIEADVDGHLAFSLSVSSAFFLVLLFPLIAAGYYWLPRLMLLF